jgi:membrane protein
MTGREIARTVREENVPFVATSIAYYAIASTVPLLALGLVELGTYLRRRKSSTRND